MHGLQPGQQPHHPLTPTRGLTPQQQQDAGVEYPSSNSPWSALAPTGHAILSVADLLRPPLTGGDAMMNIGVTNSGNNTSGPTRNQGTPNGRSSSEASSRHMSDIPVGTPLDTGPPEVIRSPLLRHLAQQQQVEQQLHVINQQQQQVLQQQRVIQQQQQVIEQQRKLQLELQQLQQEQMNQHQFAQQQQQQPVLLQHPHQLAVQTQQPPPGHQQQLHIMQQQQPHQAPLPQQHQPAAYQRTQQLLARMDTSPLLSNETSSWGTAPPLSRHQNPFGKSLSAGQVELYDFEPSRLPALEEEVSARLPLVGDVLAVHQQQQQQQQHPVTRGLTASGTGLKRPGGPEVLLGRPASQRSRHEDGDGRSSAGSWRTASVTGVLDGAEGVDNSLAVLTGLRRSRLHSLRGGRGRGRGDNIASCPQVQMGGEVASLLDSLASNWDGYLETGGQDGTTNTANTTNVTTVNNTQTTTSIDEDNHHPFNSNGSNALFTSGTEYNLPDGMVAPTRHSFPGTQAAAAAAAAAVAGSGSVGGRPPRHPPIPPRNPRMMSLAQESGRLAPAAEPTSNVVLDTLWHPDSSIHRAQQQQMAAPSVARSLPPPAPPVPPRPSLSMQAARTHSVPLPPQQHQQQGHVSHHLNLMPATDGVGLPGLSTHSEPPADSNTDQVVRSSLPMSGTVHTTAPGTQGMAHAVRPAGAPFTAADPRFGAPPAPVGAGHLPGAIGSTRPIASGSLTARMDAEVLLHQQQQQRQTPAGLLQHPGGSAHQLGQGGWQAPGTSNPMAALHIVLSGGAGGAPGGANAAPGFNLVAGKLPSIKSGDPTLMESWDELETLLSEPEATTGQKPDTTMGTAATGQQHAQAQTLPSQQPPATQHQPSSHQMQVSQQLQPQPSITATMNTAPPAPTEQVGRMTRGRARAGAATATATVGAPPPPAGLAITRVGSAPPATTITVKEEEHSLLGSAAAAAAARRGHEKSRLGKELERLGVERLQPNRSRTRTVHRLADMQAAAAAKLEALASLEAERAGLQQRLALLEACVACRDAQLHAFRALAPAGLGLPGRFSGAGSTQTDQLQPGSSSNNGNRASTHNYFSATVGDMAARPQSEPHPPGRGSGAGSHVDSNVVPEEGSGSTGDTLPADSAEALIAVFGSVPTALKVEAPQLLRTFQVVVLHSQQRLGLPRDASPQALLEALRTTQGLSTLKRLVQFVSALEVLAWTQNTCVLDLFGKAAASPDSPAPPPGHWRKVLMQLAPRPAQLRLLAAVQKSVVDVLKAKQATSIDAVASGLSLLVLDQGTSMSPPYQSDRHILSAGELYGTTSQLAVRVTSQLALLLGVFLGHVVDKEQGALLLLASFPFFPDPVAIAAEAEEVLAILAQQQRQQQQHLVAHHNRHLQQRVVHVGALRQSHQQPPGRR